MKIIPLLIGLVLQSPPGDDPIGRNLFPPELVMGHQVEIGLTENQSAAIRNEMVKAQPKFVELQWQMQRETEKLAGALRQAPIDEVKTLAIAEALMNLETNIKKTHLTLLIRIKNALSDEQRLKLSEIQKKPGR
jgi:Spy/CpxP family protein refolding chaperone